MVPTVPARLRRAAELLDLGGDERVLELGCGPGALAELLLSRYPGLRYVAVDRSPVAVARATRRNAGAVADGRLVVRAGAVEEIGAVLDGEPLFDVVVAVNVNLFWTGDARAACAALAARLGAGGWVWLVHETPGGQADGRVVAGVVRSLAVPGLSAPTVLDGDARGDGVLAVGARRTRGAATSAV
ncbi:SAM-dependent methyltransferase [Cellulosimicrobium cellulans]|uniref:SAM-dependent methyltransferase n=1 Tax=Cellulosimicrobium cellulans TaxID=1710 RepID=UPI0008496992|nr:class I SAM-dependent methyltransferase [Cellulosimicrobium cellulans]